MSMFTVKKLAFLLFTSSLLASSFANAGKTPVSAIIKEFAFIDYSVIGFSQVSVNISSSDGKNINDCSGYFGQGEKNCEISYVPNYKEVDNGIYLNKFDQKDVKNSADWNFTSSNSNGTWTYKNTGEKFPSIYYWVAKGGNSGFILNWIISDEKKSVCGDNAKFTYNCLNAAVSVTTGTWSTPMNAKNSTYKTTQAGLSHMTFYGAKPVPEPETLALFAIALLGIAVRRKTSS